MSKEFKLPPLDPVLAARLSRGTLFAGNEVEDALRVYATQAVEADRAERQGEAEPFARFTVTEHGTSCEERKCPTT